MSIKYEMHQDRKTGFRSLHAFEDIRQGETILELPKMVQSNPDIYSIEIAPGVHIDCSESYIGATNHSCEPNAAIRKGRLVAWSCIVSGDEITIDYKRTETKLAAPFDCKCGNKNCLGRIE